MKILFLTHFAKLYFSILFSLIASPQLWFRNKLFMYVEVILMNLQKHFISCDFIVNIFVHNCAHGVIIQVVYNKWLKSQSPHLNRFAYNSIDLKMTRANHLRNLMQFHIYYLSSCFAVWAWGLYCIFEKANIIRIGWVLKKDVHFHKG